MIHPPTNSFVFGILFVLASGYIVYDAPICRLFLPRRTGYILYFRIITTGIFLLSISYTLVVFVLPFPGFLGLTPEYSPFLAFLFALFLWALAKGLVWLGCKFNPELEHKLQSKILDDLELAQFIYERTKEKKMILVTLESKKVYAGWPLTITNNENNKWLRITPQWSGYRDDESMINVQIDYSKVLDPSPSNPDHMLISVEKIVSVQPFDVATFQKFNPDSKINEPIDAQ